MSTILDPRHTVRGAWLDYEVQVIDKRRTASHPELRAEAREAFIGGAFSMYRIFTEKISQIFDQEKQTTAVHQLHDELRALALEHGRR